jgi:GDP-L-fucose synthase
MMLMPESKGTEVSAPILFDLKGKRVFVAGHNGMVGSAVVRRLGSESCEIVAADRRITDLTDRRAVEAFLHKERPDCIVLAAARVGGIYANNTMPVQFLMDNLAIAHNVVATAHQVKTPKLLFLGSSCIYPKLAHQPISEDELLAGPLEPTNEWYAIAKIAGIKMCQAYRRQYGSDFNSAMPTNLYGPGDNYHPEHSHVPAALLRRFHEAKIADAPSVTVWGTGRPLREFLYVDDLADACVFLLKHYSSEQPINVGAGEDISIAEFARLVAKTVGYTGEIKFDTTRADGPPRKLLDVARLTQIGWRARTPLTEGLQRAYADLLRGGGRHRDDLVVNVA